MLSEIEKRLEEATGPAPVVHYSADRIGENLDEAILLACGFKIECLGNRSGYHLIAPDGEILEHYGQLRQPTASLDAAVALVERVLPDRVWTVNKRVDGGYYAEISDPASDHEGERGWYGVDLDGLKATAALALCLALVRALRAKDQANG